jgi:hypothetical protein
MSFEFFDKIDCSLNLNPPSQKNLLKLYKIIQNGRKITSPSLKFSQILRPFLHPLTQIIKPYGDSMLTLMGLKILMALLWKWHLLLIN